MTTVPTPDTPDLDRLAELRDAADLTLPVAAHISDRAFGDHLVHDAVLGHEIVAGTADVARYLEALLNAAPALFAAARERDEFANQIAKLQRIAVEARDEARAEADLLARQRDALLDLCASAEQTGRPIHHGQVHDLLTTDPADREGNRP